MWIKIKNQFINLNFVESILVGEIDISFQFSRSSQDMDKSSVTFSKGTILTDQEFQTLLNFVTRQLEYKNIL